MNATWVEEDSCYDTTICERIHHLGCMAGCDVSILPATDAKTRATACRIKYDMYLPCNTHNEAHELI